MQIPSSDSFAIICYRSVPHNKVICCCWLAFNKRRTRLELNLDNPQSFIYTNSNLLWHFGVKHWKNKVTMWKIYFLLLKTMPQLKKLGSRLDLCLQKDLYIGTRKKRQMTILLCQHHFLWNSHWLNITASELIKTFWDD